MSDGPMSSFNEARLYMNNHLPYGRGVVSAHKDATLNVNIKTYAFIEDWRWHDLPVLHVTRRPPAVGL